MPDVFILRSLFSPLYCFPLLCEHIRGNLFPYFVEQFVNILDYVVCYFHSL